MQKQLPILQMPKLTQDSQKPIEPPILAQAIVDISAAMNKLTRSGLNKKAIIVLLQDQTGLGKGSIECVLNGLDGLAKAYTK